MTDEPTTPAPDEPAPEPPAQAESPAHPEPAPLSLVYLDVDDEITSAAARIRAAGADDVALVLPYGSRLATSRINFRLLAREAAARGKTIQIVCADGSARALAIAAGLATHASVAAFEAQRSGASAAGPLGADDAAGPNRPEANAGAPTVGAVAGPATTATAGATAAGAATAGYPTAGYPTAGYPTDPNDDTQTRVLAIPRRKPQAIPRVGPPRPPVRTGVAIGVGLAVIVSIIAGGVLALEFLPSATITLHPRAEALGPLELSVEAREDTTAPDPTAMTIPAERFLFPVEATQTFPATGIRIEEIAATGTVRFSNFDTGRSIRVVEGAVVSTEDGIEFRTLAAITLPNATIQFPFTIVPSTSSVDVEAVEPGPDGNVGNNTITVVPKGANRRLLQVTNVDATTGGARNELPEVSEDDVDAAHAALTAALIAELDRQVAARTGIPAEITLFQETRTIDEPEYSVDVETLVGTAGEQFDLTATADGAALGTDASPIQAIAEARLATRVTDGWSIKPGSVATDVGDPVVLGTTIVYAVTIEGTQVRDVDEDALLTAIRGLALPDARARLDDFGDVDIEVWPDWVTKIPTRTDRVTFNLAEPQASAAP